MNNKIDLNSPYTLGDLELKNRFAMAPLTRMRGDKKTNIPSDIMETYYEQRATFGLIITECSPIGPLANGFPGAGGIYTKEQTNGWKKIVDKVHAKGSKIILQIWHCGRATPSEFLDGKAPVSSSPVPIPVDNNFTGKPHPIPKQLTIEEIKEIIEQFRKGAEFAKQAGFDGIQLHGANGYLVDQFLRDGVNKRTDKYGGSIENRSRFLLEVIDALCTVFPSNRVSVRLSPTGRFGSMYDSNPIELMRYILAELSNKKLHFVEIKRHGAHDSSKASKMDKKKDVQGQYLPDIQIPNFFSTLRPLYKGILMGNDGFNPETAVQAIEQGHIDIVSFGTLAISNPDLPQRYAQKKELIKPDQKTFYSGGTEGYTDYPIL